MSPMYGASLPEITDFEPDVVVLTPEETLAEPLTISYRIEPPEYLARTVEIQVRDLNDGGTSLWPASSRSGEGSTDAAARRRGRTRARTPRLGGRQPLSSRRGSFRQRSRCRSSRRSSSDLHPIPAGQPGTRCRQPDHLRRARCLFVQPQSSGSGHAHLCSRDSNRSGRPRRHSSPMSPSTQATTASPSVRLRPPRPISRCCPGDYNFELHGVSQVDGHPETEYGDALSSLLHAGLVAGGPRHGQGGGPLRRPPGVEPRRSRDSRPRRAVEFRTQLFVVIGGAGPPRSGLDPQLARAGDRDPVRRVDPHRHRGFRDALHTRMVLEVGSRRADTTAPCSCDDESPTRSTSTPPAGPATTSCG